MKTKFLRELIASTLLGVAVFGWVFHQAPEPRRPVAASKITDKPPAVQPAGKRADQIPSVVRAVSNLTTGSIEPIALQTPDQALRADSKVLAVTATSLKMRRQPAPQSDLVSVYDRGATFEQVGESGEWLQVRSIQDGKSGWMFGKFLQTVN